MHQANALMLAVLVIAPVIGLAWGFFVKKLVPGLVIGLAVGAGNFALWMVYNAITNSLGLDTVKNLLVNLGLFIGLGIVIGLGVGWYQRRQSPER
jgi:hypothetical protein